MPETRHAHAYADGSCLGNPGPGGWGVVIDIDGRRTEAAGSARESTNNRMELTAAIEALERTDPLRPLTLTTDSRYVLDGITQWITGWKRRGWTTAKKKPVLNATLWQRLDRLRTGRAVTWCWTRGHSGDPGNERADALAQAAARNATNRAEAPRDGASVQTLTGPVERDALIEWVRTLPPGTDIALDGTLRAHIPAAPPGARH